MTELKKKSFIYFILNSLVVLLHHLTQDTKEKIHYLCLLDPYSRISTKRILYVRFVRNYLLYFYRCFISDGTVENFISIFDLKEL